MPLKLSVGLTKKVGQPDYGSLGASCYVELELEHSLLDSDLDGFHERVRRVFTACRQAVTDELARQQGPSHQAASNGSGHSNRNGSHTQANGDRPKDRTRRATASQVRALRAITDQQGVDLDALTVERYETRVEELSIVEASQLIDELKGAANGAGGRG